MSTSTTSPQKPKEWYKSGSNYLISTSPSLLDPAAINAAFDAPDLDWAKPLPIDELKMMLEKSLCFGVYELPRSTVDIAGRSQPPQIGLARLITDEISFAYLTDVYILPAHRNQGLGAWLIDCVDEVLCEYKELRRAMCMVTSEKGAKFYAERLGMKVMEQGGGKHGLVVMSRKGGGAVFED